MALPLDVLEKSLNKKMALQLKDGRTVEGKLVGFDQYMNLVLEESEERQTSHKPGSTEPPSVTAPGHPTTGAPTCQTPSP